MEETTQEGNKVSQDIKRPSGEKAISQNRYFLPMLGTVLLVLLVVAGIGVYYLGTLKNKAQSQNPAVTSEIAQPTQLPIMPDETANWQQYISPEFIIHRTASQPDNDPSPLQKFDTEEQIAIKFPKDWKVSSSSADPLILQKGDYKITIDGDDNLYAQPCPYDNREPAKEISSPFAYLLRIKSSSTDSSILYRICAGRKAQYAPKDYKHYEYVDITNLGRIEFHLPKNYNENTLTEMDKIISTLGYNIVPKPSLSEADLKAILGDFPVHPKAVFKEKSIIGNDLNYLVYDSYPNIYFWYMKENNHYSWKCVETTYKPQNSDPFQDDYASLSCKKKQSVINIYINGTGWPDNPILMGISIQTQK